MTWIFDDGGRAAAGYRGWTRDCTVRAIAIATGRPYAQVYDDLLGSGGGRRGVSSLRTRRYLADMGWWWAPTMRVGTGCRVHLRAEELPPGRLIVRVSHHLTAVIEGIVHDLYDPTRQGTRCVYGLWRIR